MLGLTKIWRLAEGRHSIGEAANGSGRAPKDGQMVPITIGVPVYNGADLLGESLACLARQTFGDFKVLIYDNASTDATPEIAQGWAARDARFQYVRQPDHISGVANFRSVLQAAESPWFTWRADDDLSADDYIETLYRLATRSPGCKLAVSTIRSCDLDGGRLHMTPAPEVREAAKTIGRLKMLFGSHNCWFYGLWDRQTALNAYLSVTDRYPFAFASDHLTLYGPIIDGVVRATEKTEFIQRTRRTALTPRRQSRAPFSLMVETRRLFRAELRQMRDERRLSPSLRAALVASELFYLHRTLPSLLKVARTRVRELLGISGPGWKPGYYFERKK
jgi:glycosyltransferase involved in cell wall biosynthesis